MASWLIGSLTWDLSFSRLIFVYFLLFSSSHLTVIILGITQQWILPCRFLHLSNLSWFSLASSEPVIFSNYGFLCVIVQEIYLKSKFVQLVHRHELEVYLLILAKVTTKLSWKKTVSKYSNQLLLQFSYSFGI